MREREGERGLGQSLPAILHSGSLGNFCIDRPIAVRVR